MSQAAQALAGRLSPFMKARGFVFRKASEAFVRKEEFGFSKLSLPSFFTGVDGGRQRFSPGLAVRHNRVDDVVNQLGHIYGDDNRRNTTTIYRGLEFFPFRPDDLSVLTVRLPELDRDVDVGAAAIERMMTDDGFAFLERYSSVLECSRGLNEPLAGQSHPLLNAFPLRAYYGVATAAVSEPERVASLVAAYAALVRGGMVDAGVYDVGADLTGPEAVIRRLEYVAELGMAA